MPIYAYKCGSCGHAKDVLQKISDSPLTVCPACGASAFSKQLTAAGFQLKGSGWYATDFRNGSSPAPAADSEGAKPAEGATSAPDSNAKPAPDSNAKPADGSNVKPADGGGAKPASDSKTKPAPSTPGGKSDAPAASAVVSGNARACR